MLEPEMTESHWLLPPYDPTERCDVCGYDLVSTKYRSAISPRSWAIGPDKPHLVRRCQRCDHQWFEDVISHA